MPEGLLLIDIQKDYFPGGAMELEGSEAAARTAGELLASFRRRALPAVHIQHLAVRPGATFFVPGTEGAAFRTEVRPAEGETVIQKHFPNAFRETGLLMHLERLGVRRLVVAGMMTHMCLDATVRSAADFGFECRIASDGCATRDLEWEGRVIPAADVHAAFLAALHGTYGRVMSAEAILKESEGGGC